MWQTSRPYPIYWTWYFSLPQNNEDKSVITNSSTLVALGDGLPMILRKTLKRQVGEYIDFSELPPAKGKARALPTQWEGHILVHVVHLKDLKGS